MRSCQWTRSSQLIGQIIRLAQSPHSIAWHVTGISSGGARVRLMTTISHYKFEVPWKEVKTDLITGKLEVL